MADTLSIAESGAPRTTPEGVKTGKDKSEKGKKKTYGEGSTQQDVETYKETRQQVKIAKKLAKEGASKEKLEKTIREKTGDISVKAGAYAALKHPEKYDYSTVGSKIESKRQQAISEREAERARKAEKKTEETIKKAKGHEEGAYTYQIPKEKGEGLREVSRSRYMAHLQSIEQEQETYREKRQKEAKRLEKMRELGFFDKKKVEKKEKKSVTEKVQQAAEEAAKETEGFKSEDIFVGKPELVDTQAEEKMYERLTGEDIPDTAAEMKKQKISRLESRIEDISEQQKKRRQTIEKRKERLKKLPPGTELTINGKKVSVSEAIKRLESRKLMYKVGKRGKEEVSAIALLAGLEAEKSSLEAEVGRLRQTPFGRVALGEGSVPERMLARTATVFSPSGFRGLAESVVGEGKPSTVVQQTAERKLRTVEQRGIGRGTLEAGAAALTSPAMLPLTIGVGTGAISGGISAVSQVSPTAGAVTGATAKAAGGLLIGMEAIKIYSAAERGEEAEALGRGIALAEAGAGAYAGSKILGPKFAQGYQQAGSKLKKLPRSTSKGMFRADLSKTVKAPKGKSFESKIVKAGGKKAFRSRLPKTIKAFPEFYKGGGLKGLKKQIFRRRAGLKKTQIRQEFKGKEVSAGRQKLLQKQKPQAKTSEKVKILSREELLEGMKKYVSKPKTKTSKMTITGVAPTQKMKQKQKLSIKEYTQEAEKMGLKLKQETDLKLKQKQKLKTATKLKLTTEQKEKLGTKLKKKHKQLLDLGVATKLKQKERQKLKLREKLKTRQRLKQKPKQVPAVKQKLGLKLKQEQLLRQKSLQKQRLKTKTLQEQATRTMPKTAGAGLLDLPSKGGVKGPDVGKVGGAKAEETEPWPKVDIISGSLARWQVGKFKTPAGPEAREEFKTKSPLKGFRSLEERQAGGFSVFDTREVDFY